MNLRNDVVQSNLRLVAYLAGRFKGRGLSMDELMSEGRRRPAPRHGDL